MSAPYIPPPPPYEAAQQEFDRKTAQALEASLSISDPQPPPAEEDDPWENFDEAAFEAAYEAAVKQRESQGCSSFTGPSPPSAHSSSSLNAEKWGRPTSPGIQPLRIHKKMPSDSQSKERPSWFEEANLGEGSAFQSLSSPTTPFGETGRAFSGLPQHQIPPEQDEDRTQAPPPFQSVEPSLDGPPFEEVVMAYHGNSSAPPSPLSSSPPPPVHSFHPSHPQSRRQSPSLLSSPQSDPRDPSRSPRPHAHQSLPPPARRAPHRMSPRPATSFVKTVSQPLMNFDHSVAYTKRDDGTVSPTTEPRTTNAAAFYNSAVSSHLSITPSTPASRAFQPHMRQSQYNYHQPTGSTALPNTSSTHSVPSFLPYALRPGAAHPAQPSDVHTHQYLRHAGGTQARWATSEEQIGRDF